MTDKRYYLMTSHSHLPRTILEEYFFSIESLFKCLFLIYSNLRHSIAGDLSYQSFFILIIKKKKKKFFVLTLHTWLILSVSSFFLSFFLSFFFFFCHELVQADAINTKKNLSYLLTVRWHFCDTHTFLTNSFIQKRRQIYEKLSMEQSHTCAAPT